MQSVISVSPGALAHAPYLQAMGTRAFVQAFGPANTQRDMDKYLADEMSLEKFTADLADPANTFFVALLRNELVGYTKLRTGWEPGELAGNRSLEIERLYVLAEHQNLKIGSLLMQQAIDFARGSGFDTLWLGVWEHNPNAIRFYERWGFEFFGSHPFLLGYDPQTDLLMKKDLHV